MKKENSPWRPTISATCSELGTGTHSVVFWDFLPLESGSKDDRASEESDDSPNIDSSRANWRARWSSTRDPDPTPIPPDRWWWELLLSWVERVESLSWKRLEGITNYYCWKLGWWLWWQWQPRGWGRDEEVTRGEKQEVFAKDVSTDSNTEGESRCSSRNHDSQNRMDPKKLVITLIIKFVKEIVDPVHSWGKCVSVCIVDHFRLTKKSLADSQIPVWLVSLSFAPSNTASNDWLLKRRMHALSRCSLFLWLRLRSKQRDTQRSGRQREKKAAGNTGRGRGGGRGAGERTQHRYIYQTRKRMKTENEEQNSGSGKEEEKKRGSNVFLCIYCIQTNLFLLLPFFSSPLFFSHAMHACISRSVVVEVVVFLFPSPTKNQWKQTGIFEGEKMRGKRKSPWERFLHWLPAAHHRHHHHHRLLLPPLLLLLLSSSSSSLLSNFSHAFDRIRVTSFPSSSSLDRNERPLRRLLRTCFLSLFLRYTFAFSHLLFAYRFPLYLVFLFLSLIFAECTLLFVVPHSLVLTKIQGKKERDRKVNEKKSPWRRFLHWLLAAHSFFLSFPRLIPAPSCPSPDWIKRTKRWWEWEWCCRGTCFLSLLFRTSLDSVSLNFFTPILRQGVKE